MSAITPRTASSAIAVTVVVPTCGRMDLLDRCLDALTRQSLPGSAFDIVVVDDKPRHTTLRLVAGWRARSLERGPRLIYLPNNKEHGQAAARNLGWRSTQAPLIAFTDEDTVPSPAWLAQGLAAFGDDIDVVHGRLDTPLPSRPSEAQHAARRATGGSFHVANCICRRQLLASLGGFDQRFAQARHCDADFHFRLLASGARMLRVLDALVVRPWRPVPWGASLLRTRGGAFDALLYKKHPQLYRERIAATPPWAHYLAVAALLAAFGARAAGADSASLFAAVLWLACTARICHQRLRGTALDLSHIAEVIVTSALMPPLAVFWRLAGAIRYRVRFS